MKKSWLILTLTLINFLLLYYARVWFYKSFLLTREMPTTSLSNMGWLTALALVYAILFSWLWSPAVQKILRSGIRFLQKPTPTQWTILVMGIALLSRASWVLFRPLLFGDVDPPTDLLYRILAENLIAKKGLSLSEGATALYPVGFPFLLSILYSLFDAKNELAIRLINVLLNAGIVLSSYWLFRRLMNELIARLASLFVAISWQQILFCDRPNLESATTLVTLWVVYFSISPLKKLFEISFGIGSFALAWALGVYHYWGPPAIAAFSLLILSILLVKYYPSTKQEVGLGIFIGLGLLIKPILMFFPLILIYIYFSQDTSWMKALKKALLVSFIMIITVSPWVLRNSLLFKTPTFLLTQGGLCLWEFNATLFKGKDPEFDRMRFYDSQLTKMQRSEVLSGIARDPRGLLDLNESQIDKIMGRRAWHFLGVSLVQDPWGTAIFFIRKVIFFLASPNGSGLEQCFRRLEPYERPWKWYFYLTTQVVNQFFYNAFLFLAFLGASEIIRFGENKRWLLPLVMILYFLLFHLPFSTMERYRFPIWPFVFAYIAHALIKLSEEVKG